MNEKPKGKMIPKQKLEIVKYEGDIPYGSQGRALDRIQAKNLSLSAEDPLFDKTLRHTVFSDTLKTFLRALGEGSQVVVDIEERERPDVEYGPDRTIVQAYDKDGNPVSTKQKGGGGGNYRRSLEEDMALEAVKRRSIEGQVAMDQVGALLRCDASVDTEALAINAEDLKRIVGKYWKVVELMLDNYLEPPKDVQKPVQKPPGPRQKADTPKADTKDPPTGDTPIKHAGDLMARASKLDPPVSRAEILEGLSLGDKEEIQDLEKAWIDVQAISASKKVQSAKLI